MYLRSADLIYVGCESRTSKKQNEYCILHFYEEGTGRPVAVYYPSKINLHNNSKYVILYNYNEKLKFNKLQLIKIEEVK